VARGSIEESAPVSVKFAVNELPTPKLRQEIETSVLEIFSDRPDDEVWILSVHGSTFGLFYRVVVNGPMPSWERLFFESADKVPAAVCAWLRAYPPRPTRLHSA
jgi:hypothetical protein